MPRATIPPLLGRFPIVDPATGNPTLPFCKVWQDFFTNESGTNQTAVDAAALAGTAVPETRMVNTTAPLAGGGPLSADLTLSHNTSGVTPGVYTSANITVDADGHVTNAANGAGGTGNPWWWSPPSVVGFSLASGDATSPTFTADTDLGPVLKFNSASVAGDITRAAVETITTPAAAWSYEVRMLGTVWSTNFGGAGLIIRNVANNRNLQVVLQNDGITKLQYRTMSTFSSNGLVFFNTAVEFADSFLKVAYDGAGNVKFYTSTDGKYWRFAWSEAVASYLLAAPDKIGFCTFTNNAGITDDLTLSVQRRVKSW